MSEKNLSNRLRNKLGLDVWHRIENSAENGTPDVWYAHMRDYKSAGWIELKHVHDYPRRPTTPIRFHRFTLEQVGTIELFGRAGAYSWVLVQVAADHYLFNWTDARELQLAQPRFWWEAKAIGVWKSRLNYDQLRKIIAPMD